MSSGLMLQLVCSKCGERAVGITHLFAFSRPAPEGTTVVPCLRAVSAYIRCAAPICRTFRTLLVGLPSRARGAAW